jgi:hypothetical protein
MMMMINYDEHLAVEISAYVFYIKLCKAMKEVYKDAYMFFCPA